MGMRQLLRMYMEQRGAWLGWSAETERGIRSRWGGNQIMESRECLSVKRVAHWMGSGELF